MFLGDKVENKYTYFYKHLNEQPLNSYKPNEYSYKRTLYKPTTNNNKFDININNKYYNPKSIEYNKNKKFNKKFK
jgi:hypothetical protein